MTTNTVVKNKMDLQELKGMTVKELSIIALEIGISLSYKHESGVRKRLTKNELINKIVEVFCVKVEKEVRSSTEKFSEDLLKLAVNKIVGRARVAQKENDYETVKSLVNILNNKIKTERINSFEVAKMSSVLNILKGMLKVKNKKK